jgi:hypothetical protein
VWCVAPRAHSSEQGWSCGNKSPSSTWWKSTRQAARFSSLSLSAALFNSPFPLQALDFVFHLFGDLPNVFVQVLARAQGLQCMHCL